MSAARVVRDGKVAVLYSPGFGAGWSTWSAGQYGDEALFCPELVEAVERKACGDALVAIALRRFPKAYTGGVGQLEIKWLPEGTSFKVREYDGSESVEVCADVDWKVA